MTRDKYKYKRICVQILAGFSMAILAASSSGVSAASKSATSARRAKFTAGSRPAAHIRTAATSCRGPLGPGAFVGGKDHNSALYIDGAVLGGSGNSVCDQYSGIGAGIGNSVYFGPSGSQGPVSSQSSFIGAGVSNLINTGSHDGMGATGYSFIGSGQHNSVIDESISSAVTAGGGNSIVAGLYDYIGGGVNNMIEGSETGDGDMESSAIVAGEGNVLAFNNSGEGESLIGAGADNAVSGGYSLIGAGASNVVAGSYSAVGAGSKNKASGTGAFIGAGGTQTLSGPTNTVSGNDAFLGAGDANSVGSLEAFIGSGKSNTITPNGTTGGVLGAAYTVIAGGGNNSIGSLIPGGGMYGAIGGGHSNTLSAFNGVIGGGASNTARGDYAVVPGGVLNTATGFASFAAGRGSQALHDGAFIWSDDAVGATALRSSGVNQFLVRASGGFAFYSNAALTAGVTLRPGSGSWASLSDRASKTNVVALSGAEVLAKVAVLPVTEWSYRSEHANIRHVGPMAQDFYAAFGVGDDDRHITTIDEEGVALAAIKGLYAKNLALEDQVRRLEARDAKLEADVAALFAHGHSR